MYGSGEESENRSLVSEWASEVIHVSSCYGSSSSISYSAVNICGKLSKFPQYGDFAECFSMRKFGPSEDLEFCIKDQPAITFHDFIILKYEGFIVPKSIKIYETYNPGAVVRIYAYCKKKWIILWEGLPAPVEKKSREFCPPLKDTNGIPTSILRIEFNHSLIDYYTGIDGVLLSGYKFTSNMFPEKVEFKPGVIQKKLETVCFEPQTATDSIEIFFKNDLSKFIENSAISLNSEENEQVYGKDKNISELPFELLYNIFSYLDLSSLYRCSSVCKSFRQIAMDPLLFVEVNLKFYWNLANSSLVQSLSRRCTLIKKLDLSSCGFFESITSKDFVDFVNKNGRGITHLRLNSSPFLNSLCFEAISKNCRDLTELSVRNYVNVNADHDFSCLSTLSKLTVLDLSKSAVESTSTLLKILKNNPNLMTLNLAFSSVNINMDELCLTISATNKNIRSIDLWKSHHLTTTGLRAISECKLIEQLDLGWCLREELNITESLKMLLANCKNLKTLNLTAVRQVTEMDLENISSCENLEILDLMGIVGVGKEMCLRILRKCTKLTRLDVSFCENVDEESVAKWRNEFGHRVCIKRSETTLD